MNIARCAISTISRALLSAALFAVSVFVPQAFGDVSIIPILSKAPLGLPRLAPEAHRLGKKPVGTNAFEQVPLSPGSRSRQNVRNGATYLEIEPGAQWQQPLRSLRARAGYISFTLNGSAGTQIDIGGASFVIQQSEQDAAYAAIHASGVTDRSVHETPWLLFGGARMAALNIVTVKVDQKTRTWAMWFRDALVANDVPLSGDGNGPPKITVTAGKAGAWLCGLVCSDENPLFEDANDNTVPDDFEQRVLGTLLSADAAEQSQAVLRMAWQEEMESREPSHFVLLAPLPDSFPNDCAPEGQVVHNMPGGLKFGTPKNR